MPPSKNVIADKLASLRAQTLKVEYKPVDTPQNAVDPLEALKSNTGAHTDTSNTWTIDLFPSVIPVLMYLMIQAKLIAADNSAKIHAKYSTPTVTMYFLAVYYGYFLASDAFVRPDPSAHAKKWLNDYARNDFINFLLNLPVPEFMESIFEQLAPCSSNRRSHVYVVPSAAGFDHHIFFGRFVPLSFFAAIHDCTAELPGNSNRFTVLQDLFSRHLYTVKRNTAPGNTDTIDVSIADILGITESTTANRMNYMNSKFYQIFNSVFNPVLFRDFQRRSSLASLSFVTPAFDTPTPNAYDVLFSFTAANAREMKIVLSDVQEALQGVLKFNKNLCSVLSDSSGINAFNHGYSEYALPTWSSNPQTTFDTMTHLTLHSEAQQAQRIRYLATPAVAAPTNANDIPVLRSADSATTTDNTWTIHRTRYPLGLLAEDQDQPLPRYATDLVLFDEERHPVPKTQILDVASLGTPGAHLTTLTGKVIESFELDGTSVAVPHPTQSNGSQNSLFADSLIPFHIVIRGISFFPRPAGDLLHSPLRRAAPLRQARQPGSTLLVDRTKLPLAAFNRTTNDALVNGRYPGMQATTTTYNWFKYALRFIGLSSRDARSRADTDDSIPGISGRQIYLFSPYTYTAVEDEDTEKNRPSESRSYFLSNLRTIFGSDIPLIEAKHIFEAMPSK